MLFGVKGRLAALSHHKPTLLGPTVTPTHTPTPPPPLPLASTSLLATTRRQATPYTYSPGPDPQVLEEPGVSKMRHD